MSIVKDTFFGGAEKKAGQAQERSAREGIAEQRRQFDITQQQIAPFRQAGLQALQSQLALLGLPGLDPAQFASQQPLTPAQKAIQGPIGKALVSREGRGGLGSDLFSRAFRTAGLGADQSSAPISGAQGQTPLEGDFFPAALTQEQALAQFTESPGQRFLRERQERALLRNASAIGGLGGGNVRTALQEQAFGLAQTDLQNQLNRLAGLSGSGQTATTNLGQLGAQTAGNIQQGLLQAGQGQADAITGRASGIRSGVNQVAQLIGFSDSRLKKNIKKIGELASGLSWYSWEWTEEAKRIVGSQETYGVIAQEAKEMFPEAVSSVGGFLRVDYRGIS